MHKVKNYKEGEEYISCNQHNPIFSYLSCVHLPLQRLPTPSFPLPAPAYTLAPALASVPAHDPAAVAQNRSDDPVLAGALALAEKQ